MKIVQKPRMDDGPYHDKPVAVVVDDVLFKLQDKGNIHLQMSFPETMEIDEKLVPKMKRKMTTESRKIYSRLGTFFVKPAAVVNLSDMPLDGNKKRNADKSRVSEPRHKH